MKGKNKMTKVYIIKQYQPSSDYNGEPIAAFDTLEQAIKQVKKLNDEYSENVEISENYKNFNVDDVCEDYHAYTIEAIELNREIPYL